MRGLISAITAAALVSGCASTTPRIADLVADGGPAHVELTNVPFFPQLEYQCGPAALATVLSTAEQPVTPSDLVPQVYLPGRRGSLQPEMVAATRTHDRLPYLLAPTLADAVAQLEEGRPVLVMQNLGLKTFPAWHFAVLVGYDAPADTVVLRSGETERLVMKARRFDRTWARAQRWGLVALPPGELPAEPDLDRYMAAAASLEAVGKLDGARAAYARGRDRWPESAWAWLGIANLYHQAGELEQAQASYLEALARDSGNVAAHNNLAQTLEERGCVAAARIEVETARELARGTALEASVEATAERIASRPVESAEQQQGEQTSCSPTLDGAPEGSH